MMLAGNKDETMKNLNFNFNVWKYRSYIIYKYVT